jgi:hypothetical protein
MHRPLLFWTILCQGALNAFFVLLSELLLFIYFFSQPLNCLKYQNHSAECRNQGQALLKNVILCLLTEVQACPCKVHLRFRKFLAIYLNWMNFSDAHRSMVWEDKTTALIVPVTLVVGPRRRITQIAVLVYSEARTSWRGPRSSSCITDPNLKPR